MNWFVAFLWLAVGVAFGFGVTVTGLAKTLVTEPLRRAFFRRLAQYWPDDLEAALRHTSLLRPRDTLPEPIQFQTCAHCQLPWPLQKDGRFNAHPRFDERLSREACPGSGTCDFLDFE